MKETPIPFTGPMVRAILEGRKTMTRRVLKKQPYRSPHDNCWEWNGWGGADDGPIMAGRFGQFLIEQCPYGQPGDRLWVRETWVELMHTSPGSDMPELCEGDKLMEPATSYVGADGETRWTYSGRVIAYRATSKVEFCDGDGFIGEMANKEDMPRWKPSIFMPRWASRIMLEITSILVERVQDITEEDAKAECSNREAAYDDPDLKYESTCGEDRGAGAGYFCPRSYVDGFRNLWDSINSKRGFGWDANPYVWVVGFRRVQ